MIAYHIFIVILSLVSISRVLADVKFYIVNNCNRVVWAGVYGREASDSKSDGAPYVPGKGGWSMDPMTWTSISVPNGWFAARFWGRTGCTKSPKIINGASRFCETGCCGRLACADPSNAPPSTGQPCSLVEITLKGPKAQDQDFYDVSLVDAYNMDISIEPFSQNNSPSPNPSSDPNLWCTRAFCRAPKCPPEMMLKNANGSYVGCYSACSVCDHIGDFPNSKEILKCNSEFTDMVCCRGAYNDPEKCSNQPMSSIGISYSDIFKKSSPFAYSYAYDDRNNVTFNCISNAYIVTFCPRYDIVSRTEPPVGSWFDPSDSSGTYKQITISDTFQDDTGSSVPSKSPSNSTSTSNSTLPLPSSTASNMTSGKTCKTICN